MPAKLDGKIDAIKNALLKGATKYGISLGGEILEEELQNLLEPAFRTIIFGEKYDMPTVQEIIDTAIIAFITTSAIEGPGITSETIQEYGNNNALPKAEIEATGKAVKPAEVKQSLPEVKFTDAEIQSVQSIGRKSVNSFNAQDIAATEKLAQRHWEELGEKSPFYRAENGDWRETDQTTVQIATQPDATRGVQNNTDTGWDIQVSGKVFNETRMHTAPANKAAQAYLPYINDIVKNAVLLDSYAIDSGKTKSQNSLMMHSMYAVADIGNGPEVLKLYVEEMNDPNKPTTVKRVYQLQNIEKQQLNAKGSGKSPSPVISTAAINNVADLFAAVKAKDAAFQPKTAPKTANGKVGWDGRVAVTEATGPNVTVDGKTYALLGKDANGSPVYQDVEVLQEQAAEETVSTGKENATQTEKDGSASAAENEQLTQDLEQGERENSKNLYEATVVSPTVKTAQYRRLYNNLEESVKIQRYAYQCAKEMLQHRSGTKFEDMTYINTVTGEQLTRSDYDVENQVMPSKRMKEMVQKSEPYTVIALHNHPGNSVPSMADIHSAYVQKYKYGLIVCHNGVLMRYCVTGESNYVVVPPLLDKAQKYLYNNNEKALQRVLAELKEENIILEVFK